MPEEEVKRGRGRPRGSRVVKNRLPARRSTRGATASGTQQADEVHADEPEAENQESPAPDGPSADDSAWEVERQIMQDEFDELRNNYSGLEHRYSDLETKYSDLEIKYWGMEETLRQTQNESSGRLQEVTALQRHINAIETRIKELQDSNQTPVDRVRNTEDSEALSRQRVRDLLCGEPRPSGQASSGRDNPSASFDHPSPSFEDGEAAPRRSQQASGARRTATQARRPQSRTAWDDDDTRIFVDLIGEHGSRYSDIEAIWKRDHPGRHPRDQRQMKDKARNLKISYLKEDRRLPKLFDEVNIHAIGRAQIEAAGRNPYRKENDKDIDGFPTNIYFNGEQAG